MAKKNAQHFLNPKLISLAVASCFTVGTAIANPTGPTVVSGTATIQQAANLLQITNSPNAILNWQRFSIGANEITRFIQQSASSAVLNRVIGAGGSIDPSVILGALQSNGRVFLINPSGIVFGSGAQIDVAGLVASSLNLSNADFLAGRMKFTDVPGAGSVVNQGNITTGQGGQVYLVAPDVANTGIITTPQGEVVLAAGKSVELVNPGTPNLRVEVTADNEQARNLGQIVADSGRIGIYAGLVSQSGTLRADSAVSEGGHILLKAVKSATLEAGSVTTADGTAGGSITIQSGDTTLVSGSIAANGSQGQGGSVQVLGNLVGVLDGASISADGASGGGSVLVGGDYQGKNPDVQNAFRTYVGPNAALTADATANGDGGKVVVWSDDATRFYGNISAKGGSQSGNGGFAEVSSHNYLDFRGLAKLGAANGASGTLLLDPNDVTINLAGPDDGGFIGEVFTLPSAGPSTISWATIKAQLDPLGGNSNAIITTSGTGVYPQVGNITIADNSPDLATPNSLSLLANNDIYVNGSITNSGSGGLKLYAGWDGVSTSTPAVYTGTGTINLAAPIAFNPSSGEVWLIAGNGISQSATGPVTANALLADGGTGDVAMGAAANMVNTLAGKANTSFVFSNGQSLTIGTVNGIDGVTAGPGYNSVTYSGSANVDITVTNGDLTVAQPVSATGSGSGDAATVSMSASAGSIFVNNSVSAQGGSGESGGSATINLSANNDIKVNSDITATGGSGSCCGAGSANINLTTTTGGITVNGNVTATGGAAGSGYSYYSAGNAWISLNAGTGITVSNGTLSATGGDAGGSGYGGIGDVSLTANNGNIKIDTSTITAAGGNAINGADGGEGRIYLSAPGVGTGAGLIDVSNSSLNATGGYAGRQGGHATVSLDGATGITVSNSMLSATGGNSAGGSGSGSGYGSGYGYGHVSLSANSGDIKAINSSTITATGGDNGNGGYGNINIYAYGGNITVADATLMAAGGGGMGSGCSGSYCVGYGGVGSISLYSGNGGVDVSTSVLNATGGYGNNGGGYAYINIYGYGGGINLTNSNLSAQGGAGQDGSSGAVYLYTPDNIAITGSSIQATGGDANVEGYGYDGDITLRGLGGIAVDSSTVAARGGNGTYGGGAYIMLDAGAGEGAPQGVGGITIASSTISATGGSGSYGGGAYLTAIAGSDGITVTGNGSVLEAISSRSGANISMDTLGSITVAGTLQVSATGSSNSASANVLSRNGNITTGANIIANSAASADISLEATTGSIQSTGGYLQATTSSSTSYPAIVLAAANGIGAVGSPIVIDANGQMDVSNPAPDISAMNTGTTGDIVLAFQNTPSGSGLCAGYAGVCIDTNLTNINNNNPNALYSFTALDGDLRLYVPFTPNNTALLPGQSVHLESVQGDLVVGSGGQVIAGASGGTGNVELVAKGTLTLEPGTVVTGYTPQLQANDMDIQGVVRSGSGLIDIMRTDPGAINLGVSGPGGGALALDNTELNNMTGWDGTDYNTGSGGGLVIGSETSGPLVFAGTVGPTSAFLNVRGTSISQTSGTITGGINASASGAISLNQPGNAIDYFMGGSSGNGNITMATTGPLALDSVTTAGGAVDIRSTGDITLSTSGAINVGSGTISLISSGGAILDNHTGADIIGAQATLQGATGIGSLANPVETQIGQLTVAPSGGEVGIYNAGNLQINSVSFSGSSAAIDAAGGSMNFGNGTFALSPTTGVSLLADAGMTVGRSLALSSGNLELYSGGGDLNFSSASALNISAPSMSLIGTNINVVAGAAPVTVSAGQLGVIAGNTLTVQGGSGSGAYSELASTGGSLAVATGGDVVVKGGSGSGAYARMYGNPDVVQTLGGTAHITAGSGSGAYAQIAAAAPTTIYLSLANLSSGGFFVNGVENLVYDPATNTGFTAGGLAAILGQNLLVTYGNATGTALPPQIEQIVNTTLLASVDRLLVVAPGQEGNQFNEDEKEKDRPQVCN